MKKQTTKKQSSKTEVKKEYKSNIIKFSSVQKTKNGIAVWVGPNVIFINQGLLDYVLEEEAA